MSRKESHKSTIMRLPISAILLLWQPNFFALAQQIPGALLPFDLLGLSDDCLVAVNKTITSCPRWLPKHAGTGDASFDFLEDKLLDQLCGGRCAQDLNSAKTAIQAACKSSNDVMMPGGSVAYPATFLADRYLYATQLSCLKSSAGGYCDTIVSSWMKQSSSAKWTKDQNCSDCELGVQKMQLASPFGYDDEGAATFASLTSSCNAGGYTYATPAPYAINATDPAPPPARTCTGTYTIQEGDTCISISASNNVSTYGLITANGFDISCNLLPPVGSTICLPKACKTYQLSLYDRCEDVTNGFHMTRQQLLAWNPMINEFCNNLASWYGWNLCTSSPEGTLQTGQSNTIDTDAPVPSNAQGQSNQHCGQWYETKKDDLCSSISLAFGISLNDFYFLNPQIDNKCSNLWLETSYCVKPVGNVATYSGYPTPSPATVFPKPTPTPTSAPPPIVTDPLWSSAAGTLGDCEIYENAFSSSLSSVMGVDNINACDIWAGLAGVAVEDLIAWNPSLSADNCVLQEGKSYCILRSSSATPSSDTLPTPTASTPTTSQPPTTTGGGVPAPTKTQDGANPSCQKWYVVVKGDGCWAIANAAGIALEDFYKWNPAIGECASLYPDYAVCVGI